MRINELLKQDRALIASKAGRASSALRVHEIMQTSPFMTMPKAVAGTGFSKPTIGSAFEQLQHLGIVQEITKRSRGRVYAYGAYLGILNEGAQPLSR
jgi:Fic family protein